MNIESAVEFATDSRVHLGLRVHDLEPSIAFYRALLGAEPSKVRPDYAKFEPEDPPVNLSLNVGDPSRGHVPGGAHHYGVQVKSTDAVREISARLELAGIPIRTEVETECCYAIQTKTWATDPDGHPWEVFVVTAADADRRADASASCCS